VLIVLDISGVNLRPCLKKPGKAILRSDKTIMFNLWAVARKIHYWGVEEFDTWCAYCEIYVFGYTLFYV